MESTGLCVKKAALRKGGTQKAVYGLSHKRYHNTYLVSIPHGFVTFSPEPGGYMRFLKYGFGLFAASSRASLEVTKTKTTIDRPM
jgi:hypothetical protein